MSADGFAWRRAGRLRIAAAGDAAGDGGGFDARGAGRRSVVEDPAVTWGVGGGCRVGCVCGVYVGGGGLGVRRSDRRLEDICLAEQPSLIR